MSSSEDVSLVIKSLLESQRFAVLATDDQEQPYLFLMAFVATSDLKKIVLVTERDTHKYAHLKSNRRVALLIDDRENKGTDTQEAVVITILGEAEEVAGNEGEGLRDLYLARHPYLEGFAKSPSCAIVRVRVRSYQVVRKFQEVVEWSPDPQG
jgi:nitroimidazol reductase NimA-like FMN-containing flavoprotein (pyridoxamine 5'-phosphate oxidase superfamily)